MRAKLRLIDAVLACVVFAAGCSERDIVGGPGLKEGALKPRTGDPVKIVTISSAVPTGQPLTPVRLRRFMRSSAQVIARASVLSEIVAGGRLGTADLQGWGGRATGNRYETTTENPYPALPNLALSYWPHLDYLTVVDAAEAAAVGTFFSREDAGRVAEDALAELGVLGVVAGEYVLARSGAVTLAPRGGKPYNLEYAFVFHRVLHGVLLNDAWIEVNVNADLGVSRLAVRDVDVVGELSPFIAVRNGQQAESVLRAHLSAEATRISPQAVVQVSTPIPAYHLGPSADEVVAVPELTARWNLVVGEAVSKSMVSVFGFSGAAVPRRLYPTKEPQFCREFVPGRRVVTRGSTVTIDLDYALSFVDRRVPLLRCEDGRIYFDEGANRYTLRGIVPGDALFALGLRNGHQDPTFCSADEASASNGACYPLTDFSSLGAAFAAVADARIFHLRVLDDGTPRTLTVELVDCPEIGGVTDCSQA